MIKIKKTIFFLIYLFLYALPCVYFYLFLNTQGMLAPNSSEDTCRYSEYSFIFNNFWEKQTCLLTVEGALSFYLPIFLYFFIIFVFLLYLKGKILSVKSLFSLYIWFLLWIIYFVFLLLRLIELNSVSFETIMGGFIGSFLLFVPLILFQILNIFFKRK